MDINTVRGLLTLVLLILFLGIVVWAFSGRRKKDFDEAAQLPLEENKDGNEEQNKHEGRS